MISIIMCSINPEKFAAVSKNFAAVLGPTPFEIIGIHDAKSLCEAYNRGIARSLGDTLIFCHDDIEIISPDLVPRIQRYLQSHDVLGCAGTTCLLDSKWITAGDPYIHGAVVYPIADAWPSDRFNLVMWGGAQSNLVGNVQALDGFFIVVKRSVLDVVRFDEENFDGFHVYDTDFTYAAYLAGFKIAVCKDFLVAHQSGGNFDEVYKIYGARFSQKYKDRLPTQASNTTKLAVARNLDRAQLLRL